MIVEPAWTQDPTMLLRRRVMLTMAAGEQDAVEIAHALSADPPEVADVFAALTSRGLAGAYPSRMSASFTEDAGLTADGRAVVSAWNAARTPAQIKRACTAAMLSWLDANDGKNFAGTDSFQADVRAYFYGEPFATDVVVAVARDLKDQGLIKGHGTWGGPVLRPQITPLGQAVLIKHGGDLGAWQAAASAGGTTINVTSSTGVVVASNSPGAQQSVHVTTDAREQVLNLAAALEQMTPALGLDPANQARAAGLVVQLIESAEVVETDPGRVQRLIGTLKEIAVSGVGSAAGTALVALADALSQTL